MSSPPGAELDQFLGYSQRRDYRPHRPSATREPRRMRSAKGGSPGQLLVDSGLHGGGDNDVAPAGGSLAALAAQYGLKPSAQRPALRLYLRELARRWSFIMGFATA